jgi:hypothetical protein
MYWAVSPSNWDIIGDIGEVKKDVVEEEREVKGGVIVGVKYFESYMSCYSCKGKVVESESGFGECGRCGMMQSLKRCKVMSTAKLKKFARERRAKWVCCEQDHSHFW